MRLKAATDERELRRVADRAREPSARRATPAYCDASVSTATSRQFFAAERTIAGPPMSMFSIASSRVQPAFATVASKG